MRHKALLVDAEGVVRQVLYTQRAECLKVSGELMVLEIDYIPEILRSRPGQGHRRFKIKPELLDQLKVEKRVRFRGSVDHHIEKEVVTESPGPPREMRGRSGNKRKEQ